MKRDFLRMKAGYLHRPRLDNLLEKGLNYSLVSVVAGPGYGKTMALAGYARKTPMQLIWLRLQETDNDIYRLWTHFTEAAGRELPELAAQMKKTALPALLGVYDVVRQLFADELEKGKPILMVLDNFECVSSPHVFELLQVLARAELPNLHIIVISNEKLPIGSIVPSSGQLRISMDDLSFTDEEIAQMFSLYGLKLTRRDMEKVGENTGRWPLALHLICVNQSGGDFDVLEEMTHQQLASELFEKHYFAGYSAALQTLLVKLSFFSRFPLELVDMLAAPNPGRFLDEIGFNAFISYDYTLELFHFQTMYRAFLRHRQAFIPEEDKREMYAFMGRWYLSHEYYYEALDCFWSIRDYDGYLNAAFLLPKVRRGADSTSEILNCLYQFPEEYARENPTLDFCKAVLLLNSMQVEKARVLLLDLLERLKKETDREDMRLLLGDTYVVLADIALLLNRDDGLDYMKKSMEYLPLGCRIRTRDLMLVGNNHAFFMPDGSPGQLERMVEYFFEYAQYADVVSNGSGYGYEWLFAAQAAFLTEQFDRSREYCFQAITKAKIMEQHDIICNAYWGLIRVELYAGDYRQAQKWLDDLTGYVDGRKLTELYELRDCASSWFFLRVGDFDRVTPWVANAAPIKADHVVDIGRNQLTIIYYLCERGRLNEAFAEITRLEERLQNGGRWHEKNLLLIHKALRLLERRDREEAVAAFKQAYDMVYQNNIMITFAEFGKFAQRLVRAAVNQTQVEFDIDWLDTVYKKAGSFEKRAAAAKKIYRQENMAAETSGFNLNAKETEILTYIAQGMTRPEISQLMDTSLSNVKRYINNIYTKLGALNRADAIHIATLNGLVGKTGDQ